MDPVTELLKRSEIKAQAAVLLTLIKEKSYRKIHGVGGGSHCFEWAQGYQHFNLTFDVMEVQEACEQILSAKPSATSPVAQHLLNTFKGECPWAPSAAPQPPECLLCKGSGSGSGLGSGSGSGSGSGWVSGWVSGLGSGLGSASSSGSDF